MATTLPLAIVTWPGFARGIRLPLLDYCSLEPDREVVAHILVLRGGQTEECKGGADSEVGNAECRAGLETCLAPCHKLIKWDRPVVILHCKRGLPRLARACVGTGIVEIVKDVGEHDPGALLAQLQYCFLEGLMNEAVFGVATRDGRASSLGAQTLEDSQVAGVCVAADVIAYGFAEEVAARSLGCGFGRNGSRQRQKS